MAESTEELEPLFDYTRIQPRNVVFLDDDDESGGSSTSYPKRRKTSNSTVEKEVKNGKVVYVLDCEEKENEDWLPPPPKISCDARVLAENSTIKELRLKKQELASVAQSAEDVIRAVEESVKKELGRSLQPSLEDVVDQPLKPLNERIKIVISIQDKDGQKQFRIYMDDKFGRLFKMYADKVKLDLQTLVFCFDGEKIGPESTPDALGMEDNDIIEVHIKSS